MFCTSPSLSDFGLHDIDLPISLSKGKRQCTIPKPTYFIANFISYDYLSFSSRCLIVSIDLIFIPKTVKETMHHPSWYNTMSEKINGLDENHT